MLATVSPHFMEMVGIIKGVWYATAFWLGIFVLAPIFERWLNR